MENYSELSSIEKKRYVYETVAYLRYRTSVESRMMLIINYLVALLGKGSSNKISIHHNFQDKKDLINLFEKENINTIRKLKAARNTVYAHMDPRQSDSKECITFEEFERCISFLNGLFDYHFDVIKNVLDIVNSK